MLNPEIKAAAQAYAAALEAAKAAQQALADAVNAVAPPVPDTQKFLEDGKANLDALANDLAAWLAANA